MPIDGLRQVQIRAKEEAGEEDQDDDDQDRGRDLEDVAGEVAAEHEQGTHLADVAGRVLAGEGADPDLAPEVVAGLVGAGVERAAAERLMGPGRPVDAAQEHRQPVHHQLEAHKEGLYLMFKLGGVQDSHII